MESAGGYCGVYESFLGRFKVMVSDPPFNHLLFLFAVVSISRRALANVSADPIAEGSVAFFRQRRRKRAKSLKEVRADPSRMKGSARARVSERRWRDGRQSRGNPCRNSKGLSARDHREENFTRRVRRLATP
ncbi:hypothetical protein Bca101_011757 [Brassica carinata]